MSNIKIQMPNEGLQPFKKNFGYKTINQWPREVHPPFDI
jgi:hypothetical protein